MSLWTGKPAWDEEDHPLKLEHLKDLDKLDWKKLKKEIEERNKNCPLLKAFSTRLEEWPRGLY